MKYKLLKNIIFSALLLLFTNTDIVKADELPREEINQVNIDKVRASSGIDYILLPNGEKVYSDSATYTVYENGVYTFSVFDRAGNSEMVEVEITNIDTTNPSITLNEIEEDGFIYVDITGFDNESGVSHIVLPDGQRVDSDNARYKLEGSGIYKFQLYDVAGNVSEEIFTIGNENFARLAVEKAEITKSTRDISLARELVNLLPEGIEKDGLQNRLSVISEFVDLTFERLSVTSNVDIYIKCENMLSVTLNTNTVTFNDFSGVEDVERANAVELTVNSSLPYDINAYMPVEIQNADKTATMDRNILNIKESSQSEYKVFGNVNEKVVLKDNNPAGNGLIHNIDIKLKGNIAHQKDVYKTTIKFEIEQR